MGVYHIAKELQILFPGNFGSIFIGIGGFHTEKVLKSLLGKFLENTSFESILVETEKYRENSVKKVMNGSHYSRSKRGLSMVAEALHFLRLTEFQASDEYH